MSPTAAETTALSASGVFVLPLETECMEINGVLFMCDGDGLHRSAVNRHVHSTPGH